MEIKSISEKVLSYNQNETMYSVLYMWQHKKFTSSFLENTDGSFFKGEATVHVYGLPINFSKANGFFTSFSFPPSVSFSFPTFILRLQSGVPILRCLADGVYFCTVCRL